MDIDFKALFIGLIAVVGAVATGIYWVLRQFFPTRSEHNTLERRVNKVDTTLDNLPTKADHEHLEKRVTAMESALKNLPTKDDHHKMMIEMKEMTGALKLVDHKVGTASLQTNRIEEFMLKGLNQ